MKNASTFWKVCVAAMMLAVVSGSAVLASDEIDKAGMTATASSDGYGWVPAKAINGIADQDEGWYAAAGAGSWLRIDLGGPHLVDKFGYQPRGSSDGRIANYEIYVTESASTTYGSWGSAAASGTFVNNAIRQDVDLSPTMGQYVILYAVSTHGGSAGANEVYIFGCKMSISTFSVQDQTTFSTIWTDTATVDVTIAASTSPDATIVGYIVSQSATAPPLSDTWLDPLTTYPITGGEGVITLYGWAKDSMNRTAGKSVVIGYAAAALPVISNVSVTVGYGVIAITWDTDANAVGWVDYGLSGGALDSTSSLDYGTSHKIVLSGLDIGGSYDYVIHSNDSVTISDTATTRDVVTWSGPGGFADGDGPWNLASNWDSGAVPSAYDTVLLPKPATRIRTITIDGDAEVGELRLDVATAEPIYDNAIILNANLTAHTLTLVSSGGWSQAHYPLNVNGHILSVGATGGSWGLPPISGSGQFVKIDAGTVVTAYNGAVYFAGSFTVDAGVLKGCAEFKNVQGVTVNSGGTMWDTGPYYFYGSTSTDLKLNGPGANDGTNDLGALRCTGDTGVPNPVTLETDSSIYVDGVNTVTLSGTIAGDGGLNKIGDGTLLISGPTAKTYTGETIVSEGTMEVKTALTGTSHVTVKAGATLVGVPGMFPGGALGVTVETGGTWDSSLPPGWWGNGDPNNSGVWSDPANWGGGGMPGAGDVALLPSVTGYGNHPGNNVRDITVDVPVTISELKFPQVDGAFRNNLKLEADLTLGKISDLFWAAGYSTITVPTGRTFTIGDGNIDSPLVMLSGSGTVRKVGTGKVTYGAGNPNFQGEFIVEDGVYSGVYPDCSEFTVEPGATAELNPWIWWSCPTTINGEGFNGQGAVHIISDSGACSGVLTIATDSTINVDPLDVETKLGLVLTLSGGVEGTGILTKTGLGTILITGGEKIYTGETVVSEGTVDVRTTLAGSHVTVKAGATLMGPPMWFPQGVTVEEGGMRDLGPNYWWGNGDSNNDGNWSDGVNWVHEAPPAEGEVALFPNVNGNGNSVNNVRTVTIDVPITIADLKLPQTDNFINSLTLGADLTVIKASEVNGWIGYSRIDVPADHTLRIGDESDYLIPSVYGDGTVRKIGTGQLSYGYGGGCPTTNLEYIIENGTFYTTGYLDIRNLIVNDGATMKLNAPWWWDSPATINGAGYLDNGAIWLAGGAVDHTLALVVETDATINIGGGATLTQSGAIGGSGGLTKAGAGKLVLNQGTIGGDVTITGGTVALETGSTIDDEKSVYLALGGTLDIADGENEVVAALYFDGVEQARVTWGKTGSGATNISDVFFSGRSGTLTVKSPQGLVGDVNGDCFVNVLDMIGIRNHLGDDPDSPPENAAYDVDENGFINVLDMILVRNHLNEICEE